MAISDIWGEGGNIEVENDIGLVFELRTPLNLDTISLAGAGCSVDANAQSRDRAAAPISIQ